MSNNKRTTLVFFQRILDFFLDFGKIEPTIKAVIYWTIVVVGSLIHDFHRPPDSYFSDKRNIFNVFFVKFGVAWTLAAAGPFVALCAHIKSQSNVSILKNLSRLLVFVFIWYIVVWFFDFVYEVTGVCEGSDLFSTVKPCLAEGLMWRGYDLSGHAFLLSYCSLVLSEEIQALRLPNDVDHGLLQKNRMAQHLVNFFYICCCLLMLLWEVMLIFTSVYFHTVTTKIIGVLVGIFAWGITYHFWFTSSFHSPSLPTE